MIHWTWGILQTLLGFALRIVLISRTVSTGYYRRARIIRVSFRFGVSLGYWIFLSNEAPSTIKQHEYGHVKQSMILGPLYLPLVGLPSILRAMGAYIAVRWCRANPVLVHRWYYAHYPEKWADRLGGVAR